MPVYYTPLMGIRYIESDRGIGVKHQWKSIDEISIELQLAVICSEDQNFLDHNGFDLKAIEKAFKDNQKGNRLKGGSTISQQTAKNVFLWPKRSWLRKGMETWFTFLIEICWSKERILEIYLNSIEMGDGVYGAEAGAVFWFDKSCKYLKRDEASALAAILPNPRQYRVSPETTYINRRKKWIQKQMSNYGPLNLKKADKR